MKSPWKYLTDLASLVRTGKEPEKPQEDRPSKNDEPSRGSEQDFLAFVARTDEATSSTAEAPDELAAQTDIPDISTEVAAPPSASTTIEPRHASENALERSRPTHRRAKKVKREVKATSVGDATQVEGIQTEAEVWGVPPSPTLHEQVSVLDKEIRDLRRQLALKLRVQNEQLETLLKRFES